MHLIKKISLLILATLLMGMLATYVAVPYIAQSEFVEPQLAGSEANIRKHWTAFKNDFAVVQASFDWKTENLKDAGTFLNSRIPWSEDAECRDCALRLSDDLMDQLGSESWKNLFGSAVTDRIDVSWLKSLKEYDHWDLVNATQAGFADRIRLTHNSPEYKYLLSWARLRLLAAAKEDDLASASVEVRHLAKLLHSQFTLVSTATAIAILNAESKLKTHLESVHDPRAATLPAYKKTFIEQMRRTAWGSALLVNQLTPNDILTEFTTSTDFLMFRCLGITEGMISGSYMPPELRSAFKPDRDAIIENAILREESNCRLTPLRTARVIYTEELRRSAELARYLGTAWARFLSGILYTIGPPNPFHLYEQDLAD